MPARLCAEAEGGQVLTDQRTFAGIERLVQAQPLGDRVFKGIGYPTPVFNITGFDPLQHARAGAAV